MTIQDYARENRRTSTDAERRLWFHLRARRLKGLKFRRQVPVGNYIADFLCKEVKLIVELDGSQHFEQAGYDEQRTKFLRAEGFKVVRFWNNQVLENLDAVLEEIARQVT